MNQSLILCLILCIFGAFAQKTQKGSPESMQNYYFDGDNSEQLKQVSAQLMSALAALENIQDGNQLKTAEKRRNKFEFIRFGRK